MYQHYQKRAIIELTKIMKVQSITWPMPQKKYITHCDFSVVTCRPIGRCFFKRRQWGHLTLPFKQISFCKMFCSSELKTSSLYKLFLPSFHRSHTDTLHQSMFHYLNRSWLNILQDCITDKNSYKSCSINHLVWMLINDVKIKLNSASLKAMDTITQNHC